MSALTRPHERSEGYFILGTGVVVEVEASDAVVDATGDVLDPPTHRLTRCDRTNSPSAMSSSMRTSTFDSQTSPSSTPPPCVQQSGSCVLTPYLGCGGVHAGRAEDTCCAEQHQAKDGHPGQPPDCEPNHHDPEPHNQRNRDKSPDQSQPILLIWILLPSFRS